ncbi:serine/threonine protein kinase [Pseudoteredinibacter isoporae]|uniref:Non-specific serine/threonine protein kinase n=1 Tax=Pseudoteredinibacter isoporae TaxID=570281 RepID=A0A7X0MUC6_9GAMM|nr:phosphotransferase [Pseudoteredinibacter isoporae]MBB6520471.1 non-specific serine/threonine protein kinase [Pseudoteredinibacter isoporae]NHO86038.1 phosphotransferase [Pseudoteredinibacter isoporae]NIB25511.1 phosphotransferase [Pseudoteredinibacter isoporae]
MSLIESDQLQHFYINEEQSFYLLSHRDAQKLKDWLSLCQQQLERLGYLNIELLGKGAYGFAFSGTAANGQEYVFKFARITLPIAVQERLEEEGYMLSQVNHPNVPSFIEFTRVRSQSILMMSRAQGENLDDYARQHGRLGIKLLLSIAAQMVDILQQLRDSAKRQAKAVLVHGDIKPSNLVYDQQSNQVSLIDWGAAVYGQLDHQGQHSSGGGLTALSSDLHQTNAKLGDIYFIGEEQLEGQLSSPRFDEQGLAGTLYALASGQGSRFGSKVISPLSLGLPEEFARTLANMMSDDARLRRQAGDYLFRNIHHMAKVAVHDHNRNEDAPLLPVWIAQEDQAIETVVYSSRKSFLRKEVDREKLEDVNDAELEKYYKNYLSGMADTEKAFVTAVAHLSHYPIVGGLAMHWDEEGINIDSSLKLYDRSMAPALYSAVNNIVHLGRAINKQGVFKSCIFDAKKTLHIERLSVEDAFVASGDMRIEFDVSDEVVLEEESRLHSYFEDGDDPDEMLQLPEEIMTVLAHMNSLHHTGCIIFESVELDLKIHNYLNLLDASKVDEFQNCLDQILANIHLIDGLGVSGFMKLPYKDTKFFTKQDQLLVSFYQHPAKADS